MLLVVTLGFWLWTRARERRADECIAQLSELADRAEDDLRRAESLLGRGSASGAPPPDEPETLPELLERLGPLEQRAGATIIDLLETRAMLRAIINGSDFPIVACSGSGDITLMNRAARRMLSVRSDRHGTHIEDLISHPRALELVARARGGQLASDRVRLPLGSTPRVCEITAAPLRLDISDIPAHRAPRAGVVLTLRDITDVAQTEKLRTDFVANASHELRTPIASIRGAAETLASVDPADRGMADRLREMIATNVARLEEMVSDLLDLSHLESEERALKRKALRMSEITDTLYGLYEPACRARNLSISFEFDESLDELRTDPKLLLLILRNLVDNATKFRVRGHDRSRSWPNCSRRTPTASASA